MYELFLFFQEGDFKQGEVILHAALKIAQTLNHFDGITYVYALLAKLAFRQVSKVVHNCFNTKNRNDCIFFLNRKIMPKLKTYTRL